MARFPFSESEIAALARRMITGFSTNAEDFPAPPVPPEELEEALAAYDAGKDAAVTADGAARVATTEKDDRLETLTDLMKADLRYAENTVRHDPEKLNNLGRPERPGARCEARVSRDRREQGRRGHAEQRRDGRIVANPLPVAPATTLWRTNDELDTPHRAPRGCRPSARDTRERAAGTCACSPPSWIRRRSWRREGQGDPALARYRMNPLPLPCIWVSGRRTP